MMKLILVFLCIGAVFSCSSIGTSVVEYDNLLLPPSTSNPEEPLKYRKKTSRLPWLIRQTEGSGIDWFWAKILGVTPSLVDVDDPLDFAYWRLLTMTKARDPEDIILCSYRLMLVAMKDPWDLNRFTALKGLKKYALIIGPGNPNLDVSIKTPPKPFLLKQEIRTKIEKQAEKEEYRIWREKIRDTFFYCVYKGSPIVVKESLQGLYDIWGPKGLFAGIQILYHWSRQGTNPEVLKKAALLCSGFLPDFARKNRNGFSIFKFLYTCISNVPDPSLRMVAMRSICLINGIKPRYDQSWFQKWWKKENK